MVRNHERESTTSFFFPLTQTRTKRERERNFIQLVVVCRHRSIRYTLAKNTYTHECDKCLFSASTLGKRRNVKSVAGQHRCALAKNFILISCMICAAWLTDWLNSARSSHLCVCACVFTHSHSLCRVLKKKKKTTSVISFRARRRGKSVATLPTQKNRERFISGCFIASYSYFGRTSARIKERESEWVGERENESAHSRPYYTPTKVFDERKLINKHTKKKKIDKWWPRLLLDNVICCFSAQLSGFFVRALPWIYWRPCECSAWQFFDDDDNNDHEKQIINLDLLDLIWIVRQQQ